MKSKIVFPLLGVLILAFATAPLSAQQPPRYRLVDLGTFGGPHGYGSVNGDGFQLLNNSGTVAFSADLSTPDPNQSFFCFNPDCFQTHSAPWRRGVIPGLPPLPRNNQRHALSR